MPYIVTTKRRVIEDEFGVERDRSEVRARRAVATLEEARSHALGLAERVRWMQPGAMSAQDWRRFVVATRALPESGGTVGPLPDGTVIEVERVGLADVALEAGLSYPLNLIQHHVDNLAALWRGEPVRDLGESAAGYAAALAHLRGAVDRIAALERERDELAQRLRQASRNAEAAEAEVERLTGGQYEQPATKDTTAVDALKRIRDHANSADDPAMIAQRALDKLGER